MGLIQCLLNGEGTKVHAPAGPDGDSAEVYDDFFRRLVELKIDLEPDHPSVTTFLLSYREGPVLKNILLFYAKGVQYYNCTLIRLIRNQISLH